MGEATSIIISLVVISSIIIGITAFAGDIYSNYGIVSDDLSYLNKSAEMNDQVIGIKDAIDATQVTGTWIDVPLTFVAGAFAALKLLLNIPDIMGTLLTQAGEVIGMPGWVIGMSMAVVIIIILFVILRAILKWDI